MSIGLAYSTGQQIWSPGFCAVGLAQPACLECTCFPFVCFHVLSPIEQSFVSVCASSPLYNCAVVRHWHACVALLPCRKQVCNLSLDDGHGAHFHCVFSCVLCVCFCSESMHLLPHGHNLQAPDQGEMKSRGTNGKGGSSSEESKHDPNIPSLPFRPTSSQQKGAHDDRCSTFLK